MKKKILVLIIISLILFSSCKKKKEIIKINNIENNTDNITISQDNGRNILDLYDDGLDDAIQELDLVD